METVEELKELFIENVLRKWRHASADTIQAALDELETQFPQIKDRDTCKPILLVIPDALRAIMENQQG